MFAPIIKDYLIINHIFSDIRAVYIGANFYHKRLNAIKKDLKSQVFDSESFKNLSENEQYLVNGYWMAEDHRFRVDKLEWNGNDFVYKNDPSKICY